jgi:hypothetical protein
MPDFGIFRGFNEKLFGDKLYAGQLPTQLGLIGSESTIPFISATGGTITIDGDFKIHTFTSSGTFTVTDVPIGQTAKLLVVAGGGGGGAYSGGGGGAGGLLYTAAKSLSVQSYTVTVGSGGAKPTSNGAGNTNGNDSIFDSSTAIGGGRGGVQFTTAGQNGGSGGGSTGGSSTGGTGTVGQGNNGGALSNGLNSGSGGGGAGAVGGNATLSGAGGIGGVGLQYDINGTLLYYAGGGAGGGLVGQSLGGAGGGGNGERYDKINLSTDGTANTGGGGGGMYLYDAANGGNGGSGVVIIAYQFQ